jgi:16S rRNA processing protein RimM
MEILVERTAAAPLLKDEYYIEDLKSLNLVNDNRSLGRIEDVIEGGGGFLLEIRLNSGETRLVPFRKEFIGEVCVKKGFAVLLKTWILE